MQRYFILDIKSTGVENKKTKFIDFKIEWYVVPTRGEPIGDNCFYQTRKWCGKMWCFLYDTPTGVYICRERTLQELEYRIASDEFCDRLEKVRKSDFYKLMLRTFKKALEEYKERVQGGKKNDK